MTEDEFSAVALLLENGWRGEMDEAKETAYFMLLKRFDVNDVMAALAHLSENGTPFLPTVPEIVQAVRKLTQPPVPSWSEAWDLIERANGKRTRAAALEVVAVSPIVKAFYEVEGGWDHLRLVGFYDDEHGGARQHLVSQRYEEYVDVAQARLAQGRALEASGRRSAELGKPDVMALIGGERPERAELPAGEEPRPTATGEGARATLEAWEKGE